MPSKKGIVIPVLEAPDNQGKTVSGLTYRTAGDGVGFSILCQCGRDFTLTDSAVEHIKKDLSEGAKADRPKMELTPVNFDKVEIGELLVATTDENGHGYPLFTPLLKLRNKKEGGYCMAFPGAHYGGNKLTYFYQGNKMQDNVHRIKAINSAFVERHYTKALKKFFSDIPIKKL